MQYELESLDVGRYNAYFVSPLGRVRIGLVHGAKGRWYGQGRALSPPIGPFRTRGQAAKALAGEKFRAIPVARTGTD